MQQILLCTTFLGALLGLFSLSSCTQSPREEARSKTPVKTYQLKGEVVGMDAANQVVILKHEEIKDWMDAMTMGFPVKDKGQFEKFKPGQKITAEVNVQGDEFWIDKTVWLP